MSFLRFLFRTFLILFVLGLIAYCVGWFYAASQVKEKLTEATSRTFGSGLSFQFDEVNVTGFPLAFKVDLKNLSAQHEVEGFFWQAPETVGISHSMFAPLTVKAHLSGEHLILGLGKNADLPPFSVKLDAPLISGSMGLNKQISHINLDIPSVIFNTEGLGDSWIKSLKFDLIPAGNGDSRFTTSLAEFLPPAPLNDFTKLTAVSSEGYIATGLPKSVKKRHIQAWQQGGGIVQIDKLEADLLPLEIDGQGTISLSDRLQPNVSITTYAQGFDDMLARAAQFGFIPQERLSLVQLGSAMFKRPARDGLGSEMVLPLTVKDGDVTFGPFKLVTLPPIKWRD